MLGEQDAASSRVRRPRRRPGRRTERGRGWEPGPSDWARPPAPAPALTPPCRPAAPSARRLPAPAPRARRQQLPAERPAALLPLLTQRLGAAHKPLPPRAPHAHPTPRSLQRRPLPPEHLMSKGPGPARITTPSPQHCFPSLPPRLPCLGKGVATALPPSPGRGQAARTPGGNGRVAGPSREFLTVGATAGGGGGRSLQREEEVGARLGWKEVASALDGLGWEAAALGTSPGT